MVRKTLLELEDLAIKIGRSSFKYFIDLGFLAHCNICGVYGGFTDVCVTNLGHE